MTTPDPIVLDVDPTAYLANLGRAEQGTERFSGTLRGLPVAIGPMQRAMDSLTPPRAAVLGMSALAISAGNTQAQLAQVQAQAKLTGANFGTLTSNMRSLGRDLPITNRGAREITQTLSRLGVVGAGAEKPLNAMDRGLARMNKTFVNTTPGMEKFREKAAAIFGSRGVLFGSGGTGTEKRVDDLARTFTKLSAVTGESSAGLTQGFVRLNQAMGTGLDASRVEKLADSLTTVSGRSGASATGILEFSKAIAPMSRAAGLGQTQVMGISAAFAKMGEDGYGAANAFNKMSGDLARSVREGSPLMANYAQIVGKTTGEFQKLFELDPAEALTQVTEAIGRSGNNAPRQLEQLGLDGVRTQRYLQQLSSSGGLREAIQDSVGGYGSGATEEGSQEAFDGFFDAATRAKAASEQLAEAMGSPLLGPLTAVTNVLGGLASVGEKGAGSGPVQEFAKALVWGAAAIYAATRLIKPAVVASGVGQAVTSSPFRSGLGALAMGMAGGDANRARETWAGRAGGNRVIDQMQRNEPLSGNQRMNALGQRIYAGPLNAVGGFIGQGGGGPSLLRQVSNIAALGVGSYMRMQAETLRQARTPMQDRMPSMMRAYGPAAERIFGGGFMQNLNDARERGQISSGDYRNSVRQAMLQLAKDTNTAGGGLRNFASQLVRGSAALAGQTALTGASALQRGAVGGGRLALRGVGAIGGAVGGPLGLALTAGMVGFQAKSVSDKRNAEEMDKLRNGTSWIDDYRVAMGRATQATSTFAGAMAAANQERTRNVDRRTAVQVTDEDRKAAITGGIKSRVRDYSAMSDEQAARTIALQAQGVKGGLQGGDIERIQQDLLLSNKSTESVAKITQEALKNGFGGALNRSSVDDITAAVSGLADQGQAGWTSGKRWANLFDVSALAGNNARRYTIDTLSDSQRQGSRDTVQGIKDRSGQRADMYTAEYARAQELAEVDAAVSAAFDAGNDDLAQSIMEQYQDLSGIKKKSRLSKNDVILAGGFTSALAGTRDQYREAYYDPAQQAAKAGTDQAQLSESWITRQAGGDNPLSKWFASGNSDRIGVQINRLMNGGAESASQQLSTMLEGLNQGRTEGMSYADISKNATDLANSMGEAGGAARDFMLALRSAAQQQMAFAGQLMSSGAGRMQRIGSAAADARLKPSTTAMLETQQAGVTALGNERGQLIEQARARMNQQREYQVAVTRMDTDFNTQRAYQAADYAKTVFRTEQQFNIQRERSIEAFNRQVLYSQRDFTKALRRAAEDAARAMYDPFQRIQVQPTWDAWNLLGNLEDQLDAVRDQMANLGKLRRAGASEDLIKLLGLNDPKNAQQLATVIDDVMKDPAVLRALNANAAARQAAGQQLASDPANTDRSRAVEDQAEQLRRGREQFDIALKQGNDDLKRSLSQMEADYQTTLTRAETAQKLTVTRMGEDIKRADEEIVMSLEQYAEGMLAVLNGQTVDFKDKTVSTLKETAEAVEKFLSEDLSRLLEQAPATLELSITTRRAQQAAAGRDADNYRTGTTGSGRQSSGTGTSGYPDLGAPSGPPVNPTAGPGWGFGPMPVIAPPASVTAADSANLRSAGGATSITYDSRTVVEDHSTQFSGAITVMADDPNQLARELAAKKAAANLTAPPQRRTG